MAKKMAVRKRVDKKPDKNEGSSLLLTGIKGGLKDVIFFSLILITLALIFFGFTSTKSYLNEQWPVTDISFNSGLHQVNLKEVAKIVKQKDYAFLLKMDLNALQKEIEGVDWIKKAVIRKKWPDTLEVIIEEYVPLVVINERVLVESGERLKPLNNEFIDSLAVINIDQENSYFEEGFIELFNQYSSMYEEIIQNKISILSLKIDQTNAWSLIADGDIEIKLGRHKHADRVARLNSLLPFLNNVDEVKIIDLRYSNGAAISLKVKQDENNHLVG